jgi:hypothetical protein
MGVFAFVSILRWYADSGPGFVQELRYRPAETLLERRLTLAEQLLVNWRFAPDSRPRSILVEIPIHELALAKKSPCWRSQNLDAHGVKEIPALRAVIWSPVSVLLLAPSDVCYMKRNALENTHGTAYQEPIYLR